MRNDPEQHSGPRYASVWRERDSIACHYYPNPCAPGEAGCQGVNVRNSGGGSHPSLQDYIDAFRQHYAEKHPRVVLDEWPLQDGTLSSAGACDQLSELARWLQTDPHRRFVLTHAADGWHVLMQGPDGATAHVGRFPTEAIHSALKERR